MKKLVLIILITGLVASCGSGDKKAKLEKLKQQSSDLLEQIKKLEDEEVRLKLQLRRLIGKNN